MNYETLACRVKPEAENAACFHKSSEHFSADAHLWRGCASGYPEGKGSPRGILPFITGAHLELHRNRMSVFFAIGRQAYNLLTNITVRVTDEERWISQFPKCQ